MEPFVREVFLVQHASILATVDIFGVLCLRCTFDPAERSLSGSLAFFRAGGTAIRLFVHDRDVKRRRPIADLAFLVTSVDPRGLFAAVVL